jgi:hypothetical protein
MALAPLKMLRFTLEKLQIRWLPASPQTPVREFTTLSQTPSQTVRSRPSQMGGGEERGQGRIYILWPLTWANAKPTDAPVIVMMHTF